MRTMSSTRPRRRIPRPHRSLTVVSAVVACVFGTLGGACASSSGGGPADAVRGHLTAVRQGDERAALAWLTEEGRSRAPLMPAPAEAARVESVAEVGRAARWVGEREVEVVRAREGWRIARGVLALFSVESAESALQALGRALEARDFARVYDLVPLEGRGFGSAAALEKLLSGHPAWMALASAINAGRVGWVTRESDLAEASVAVDGAEHRVVLKRADGGWKVFDVLPRSGYLRTR